MWPWNKQSRAIEEAHQGLELALVEATESEARARQVEQLAAQSRQVSARLRREIALNGWTEKFQIAMRRRA